MLPSICGPETTRENWACRREELLELFRRYEYGRRPELPYQAEARLVHTGPAFGGSAARELYHVTISTARGSVTMELALVLPSGSDPVPVVLLLSNHDREAQASTPPDIAKLRQIFAQGPAPWREEALGILSRLAAAPGTGQPDLLDIAKDQRQGYWAVEEVLASSRAAAAFYASQAQADDPARFPSQLAALFLDPAAPRAGDGWGTLGVWAFAASRMIDVLAGHRRVDAGRISLVGHSRGGKAALWCAAQDQRVHAVLVNNSGCSGAALSREKRGEVVASICALFPHWFCPNYSAFSWKEEQMPFDQHMLLAAVAPRLCCVASGSGDLWSDPDAEWRGTVAASSAWQLFTDAALSGAAPGPGQTMYAGPIAYHRREGGHALTAWDWHQFMRFLDLHNG